MRSPKFRQILCFVVIFLGFWIFGVQRTWALEDQDKKAKSLAYYTMGVFYDLHGYTDKAIAEFEKAAEYDSNAAVRLRLGADYARVGMLAEAVRELQQVLEISPDNVQARYLLALIYSTQKDFDKAAEEYENILKSFSKAEPENMEIYGYLGQLYYSQKEYQKAIKQFEIILSFDSVNADVIYLLGSLYLEVKKEKKAVELFARAIKINPDHDGSLNSLGYIYADTGVRLNEAKDLIERALKLDPDNGAYLDSLGWVYYKKGNYTKALQYLKEADVYLKDPVIYEHIGDVYFELEQKEDARKYWQLSLDMFPDQERLHKKMNTLD